MMRIAVLAAVIGCLALPLRAGDEPETIRIGATFPLTGRFEIYGQSAYYGVRARVREINAAGGVNGKDIEILWHDNRSENAVAVRDVEELADKGVQAILGPLTSEAAMAVRETARKRQVVILLPMATMDAITRDNPWIFRTCFNNSLQADAMARFQREDYAFETVGILFDARYAFSIELAELFADKFVARGGAITGKASFAEEAGDIERGLRKVAEAKPDFIYAPCYGDEAVDVVQTAKALGIRTPFAAPDSWDNDLVLSAAGSRLVGTKIVSSLPEQEYLSPPFRRFFEAMQRAGMDNPDALAANAYDAVTILATALENGETAEEIRQGLHAIERFPLATGITTITADGDALKPVLIRIVEKRGGKLIPVLARTIEPE